jgi:uncharacterized membrane-anchored protein
MQLPPDHPRRHEINNEVHARPPQALTTPVRLTYLALYSEFVNREREWRHVGDLARRFNVAPPAEGASHFTADLGAVTIVWERHTEFARYTFIAPGAGDEPFPDVPINAVPKEWIEALPGEVINALHVAVVRGDPAATDFEDISARLFNGNNLVGGIVTGGAAAAFTDFRIHGDGYGRVLVRDAGMTPAQVGRIVQRLLEIDTYRVMALLALPIARQLTPFLSGAERELAQITAALQSVKEEDEPSLLDKLTKVEAEIEQREAEHQYRFAAAAAYYDLVKRRIAELREERIQGLQTFNEFTDRRLAPAMNTCRAVAARQESLSSRVARATQLLSTRVDVTRERQNQSLLESMDRRAKLQIRLQQTVEGLSIAAVTYYVSGLIGYLAKGLKASGVAINPDIATAVAIPIFGVLAWLGVRKMRRTVSRSIG